VILAGLVDDLGTFVAQFVDDAIAVVTVDGFNEFFVVAKE